MTGHFIVIAFDRPSTRVNHRHDALYDGGRISAIADEIAEQRELRRAACMRIVDARVERLQVGMNVGEKREFHDTGYVMFENIIRQLIAPAAQS